MMRPPGWQPGGLVYGMSISARGRSALPDHAWGHVDDLPDVAVQVLEAMSSHKLKVKNAAEMAIYAMRIGFGEAAG